MLFDDVDIRELPLPIARAVARLRRALERDIHDRAIDAAFLLAEESVRMVTIELVATVLRTQVEVPAAIVRLGAKRRSFGDRVQLLGHAVRAAPRDEITLNLQEALGKRGGGLSANLESLVRRRNQFAHARFDSDMQPQHVAEVLALLDSLQPLADVHLGTRLVSVFAPPPIGATQVSILDWSGPSPATAETAIPLDPELSQRDMRPGSVLIVREGRQVPLTPLLVARDDPRRDEPELFALETVASSAEGIRATWSNLGDPSSPEPMAGDDEVATYFDLLEPWRQGHALETSREARLESYYFASTPSLMTRLLERYTEREDVPAALERLFQAGRSGSLWLVAGPGAGKSSVVASIVQEYEAIHHFVSSSEGRNNQAAIFRSLVAQLIRKSQTDELPHEDEELLPQQFSNLLVRRAIAQTESEVLVIALDALDELGDDTAITQFIQALPHELPDGVFLLMSSRPLPPGLRVPAGTTQYVLSPLSIGDIEQVARRHGLPHSARDCERAFVASHGNPLLAIWALTLLRDNPHLELSDTDEFDDILSPLLARPMLSDRGPRVVRMLAVLVASRSHLDLPTLSIACGSDRLTALQTIAALRDVVTADRRQVVLSHQAVRDYLMRPTSVYGLEQSDLAAAHAALDELARTRRGAIASRDRLWHAINSQDASRLREALRDPAVRAEFPRVIPEVASEETRDVPELLAEVAGLGEQWCSELIVEGARALALAGYWKIAFDVSTASWARELSPSELAFIKLEIARASDDLESVGELADELLDAIADQNQQHGAMRPRLYFLKGEALRVGGHHAEAMTNYELAVSLTSIGSPNAFAAAFQLADLQYVRGQLDEAGESLARLLIQARSDNDLFWETRILREIGHLDVSRDRHKSAAEWYGRSLDLALALGRRRLIAQGYTSLAEALATTEPTRAIELAELGVEHGTAAGAATELGKVRTSVAEALLTLGQFEDAVDEASRSLEMLIEVGYGSGQARARLVRAQAQLRQGEQAAAEEDARLAFDYYRRERIYPHLWRSALETMREAALRGGHELQDHDHLLAEIPHLDQL